MKKRILSLFLAFVMAVGLLPMSVLATESAATVIYTGNDWPINSYHVASISLAGAEVDYQSGYHVYLNAATARDVEITLTVTAGGRLSGNLGVNWNDEPTNTKTYTTRLVDGEAVVKVYAYKASGAGASRSGTKTFYLHTAAANSVPVLADGVSSRVTATVTAGNLYELDLTKIFYDSDGDELHYSVSVDGKETALSTPQYSYTNQNAGTYTMVFSATDGKGSSAATYTVDLTVENSTETKTMTVSVPEALTPVFYASIGFGDDGCDRLGEEVEAIKGVTADGVTVYTVNYPINAAMLSVRADGWGGMAFEAVDGGAVVMRTVQMSVMDYNENPAESTNAVTYDGHTAAAGTNGWLLVVGKEYMYKAVPKSGDLATVTKAEGLVDGVDTYIAELILGIHNPLTITVTTGATAQLYKYNQYYSNTELDAKIIKDNDDGTTTYSFVADTKNGNYIYRVSMEGKITKAGWLAWGKQDLTVEHTDGDKANTWRLDDYSAVGQNNSGITEDSVLLNINGRNHLDLSVGQSKTLKAYRAWEIIPVSYNNYIIEPDFHFNVVWESQEDVISLADKENPMTGGESWQTLTANQPGTAILEVTYDAIQVSGGSYDGAYGASDPARTGLVVVTVGGTTPNVNFGIHGKASQGSTTFSESNAKAWDAEFDTLYFTGDQGELAFAPTSNSAITEVAVSNDKGASWMALTAEEGLYTAPITSGNNILRVTTETGTAYQVVRGDKISTRLVNVTDPGQPFEAGDTVRVILDGLHTPIPKMAGNYNPGAKDSFAEGAGSLIQLNYTFCGSPVQGTGRQYDFITSGNAVEVTIPESEDGTVVSLQDGYIGLGVIGLTKFADGGDSHRNIPDGGCVTRDSKATAHTRSVLPDITIEVGGLPTGNTAPYIRDNAAETATITLGKTYAVNLTTIFGDREGDTLTYKLAAGEDAAAIDSYYTFTPETVGSYTLIFTANDGQLDSKPHTVTLTVKEAPAEEPDGPAAPDFGLSKDEIDGYVYVSFEDKGVRVAGDEGIYPKALGTILKKTRVPYTQGDTIADVTLRALDAYDFTYSHTGTTKSNFYLSSIGSFTVKGIDYDSFGEFDAGTGSGWMITWDDVFINKGASEFQVENGDVIRWQYTCQLGADIGDDGSAVGGGNQAPQVPPEVLPEVPPVTSSPYTDVTGHWAEKAITFVYEKGLMTGTKEDTFSPETELSRAMLVTILYRMEGEPAVIAQNTFSDVTDGTWYTNAVIWASQNGIVNGVGKDRFAPDRDITREQMAAMLLRYSDYKEYDTTQRNDLAGYTDAESISGWALEALQWANGEGLITGRKADLLVPQGDTTRAETATILMRYLETIA